MTRIAMIIDKSRSMGVKQDSAIQGFNDFLEDQKRIGADVKVTLRLFDNETETIFSGDIIACPRLNYENYVPDNGTALLDAISDTLEKMFRGYEKLTDKPEVIICILTDGDEQDSYRYSVRQTQILIEKAKKLGWKFIFLGAGVNWSIGPKLGIDPSMVIDFKNDKAGVKEAFAQISQITSRLRLGNG